MARSLRSFRRVQKGGIFNAKQRMEMDKDDYGIIWILRDIDERHDKDAKDKDAEDGNPSSWHPAAATTTDTVPTIATTAETIPTTTATTPPPLPPTTTTTTTPTTTVTTTTITTTTTTITTTTPAGCQDDGSGNFGQTTGDGTVVIYRYEMSLSDSNTDSVETILGDLEGEYNHGLLGLMSPDACLGRRLDVRDGGDERRRLERGIVGLSSLPLDQQVQGVDCETLPPGDCDVVVDGWLTIYAPETADTSALASEILKTMYGSMSDGTFAAGDPRIDGLALVEPGGIQAITKNSIASQLETVVVGGGDPMRDMPGILAASVVSVLLASCLVLFGIRVRRKKAKGNNDDSNIDGGEANVEVSQKEIPAQREEGGIDFHIESLAPPAHSDSQSSPPILDLFITSSGEGSSRDQTGTITGLSSLEGDGDYCTEDDDNASDADGHIIRM